MGNQGKNKKSAHKATKNPSSKKASKAKFTECPGCNAEWDIKEQKTQSCNNCGYPETNKDTFIEQFDEYEDDQYGYDDDF